MTNMMSDKQTPVDGQDHDPFLSFSQAAGIGRIRDPYPLLAQLRERGPVYDGPLDDVFGPVQFPIAVADPGARQFTVLSYDLAFKVFTDGATYSSKIYANTFGRTVGRSILEMDEPEHRTYRGLVQQAFSARAMERWDREIVGPIVSELIDRFPKRGSVDVVQHLALLLPIRVIAAMLGLPEADLPDFHRRAIEIVSITFDPERGMRASMQLGDYFRHLIAQRREKPQDDLISALAQASLNGQQLNDEEVVTFLRVLLSGGAETTYRALGNLLFALLTHTDQLEAVRRDRSLVRLAIEESLRWEPAALTFGRVATRDTELGGKAIPAGSAIHVCVGAANRDPERWVHPERFDIFRESKPHMAFAGGPHACLGMHLARTEIRVALDALLDRLPGMRLDPKAEDVHITGLSLRSPLSLPVLFD